MSERTLSLRLLKLLLSIWWWGLIVGGAVAIVFVATRSSDDVEFAMIGYASDIDTSTLTAEDRKGQKFDVRFDGPSRVKLVASGENGTMNLKAGPKIISLLLIALFFILSLYFVKQLRDIVRTIDQNDPFAEENARRVRVTGMLIIAYGMIESLGKLAMSGFADSMVIPHGFSLNGRLEFNSGLLIVGTAVIVLSEVFRHGARIREDQALTV